MKPALTPARLSSATEIASAAFEVPIRALLSRQRQKPIARAPGALRRVVPGVRDQLPRDRPAARPRQRDRALRRARGRARRGDRP
jgi:hypothetical protein